MPKHVARVTFTVPATAGQYAPERIQLNSQSASVVTPTLLGATALIEAAPASAALELWLLRVNGDPTNDADYHLYDSTTASKTWPLASFPGAQLRAKSGGTAGSMTVSATAD